MAEKDNITRKSTITSVQPGCHVPLWPARRYKSGHGYIRLRWKLRPNVYVEAYEHRVCDGVVRLGVTHHINGNKSDNKKGNLSEMSNPCHVEHHAAIRRRYDINKAAEMYRSGMSLTALGRVFSVHPVSVMRALKKVGVVMRPVCPPITVFIDLDVVARLYANGTRVKEMSRQTGVGRHAINRVMKELGLSPFPVGSPGKAHHD